MSPYTLCWLKEVMRNIYQDITITLYLNEMTPDDYQKRLKKLRNLSVSGLNTYTFIESIKNDNLTEEEKEFVQSLQ